MADEQERSEFTPLGWNREGKVIDAAGYLRVVEAIPSALDNIYIENKFDGDAFEIGQRILEHFKERSTSDEPNEVKEILKKDLEGKVGYITGPIRLDEDGDGIWITIQLYRVRD